MKIQPPRWANRFLRRFCHPDLLPEIEGDLYELHQRWIKEHGARRARWLYALNVITFLRPFALRRRNSTLYITTLAMLRNYFITAWRQVQKHKLHTTINVFGLATGMAACLVIALTVQHEFSYDRHHTDRDRIYRITSRIKFADDWFPNGGVSAPIPSAVREEVMGLEAVAGFHTLHAATVSVPDGPTLEDQKYLMLAGPDYFEVFTDHRWTRGSPESSLMQPYQVVLTENQARKYFGEQEAIGQTVTYFDSLDFVVTGILADDQRYTDFPFTDYLSYATLDANQTLAGNHGMDSWGSTNGSSLALVKLSTGTTPETIVEQLPTLVEKHMDATLYTFNRQFELQPLSDIHFNFDYPLDQHRIAHKPTLYGLALVALFLLLIASINFINLETARAVLRSREVGVRKTLGSSRGQLILQFLGETFLITLLAGGLSLLIAWWGIGYFSESLPPALSLEVLWKDHGWLVLLAIISTVSLLAGTYPAWILSAFSPVVALKGAVVGMAGAKQKAYLRRVLIVFQFAVAQAFILGALIVGDQLNYLLHKDMGFRQNAVVHFQLPIEEVWGDTTQHQVSLANELRQLSSVSSVSLSGSLPATFGWSTRPFTYQTDTSEIEVNMYMKQADTSFFKVYNLSLLAGRNYQPSDSLTELVLNETAVSHFGFASPEEAVGQLLTFGKNKHYPVVGVVQDFHNRPLHTKIDPVAMGNSEPQGLGTFNILLSSQSESGGYTKHALGQVERLYRQFYPEAPFEYQFYDDTVIKFYAGEQSMARLINIATGLAIFISCLGLLGLVSFTTHQRVKEIGIRKVLGATVAQLVTLFSREFVGLVLVSFVIAAPLVWHFANQWLQGFAYRVDTSILLFAITVSSALGLALLTVGLRSWRAALANPVDSLRNE